MTLLGWRPVCNVWRSAPKWMGSRMPSDRVKKRSRRLTSSRKDTDVTINSTPRTAAPQWRDGPQGTPLAHAHGLWVGLVPDLTGLDKAVKDLSGELAHSPKSDGVLLVPMDPEQPLGRSYSASKLAPLRIAVKRVPGRQLHVTREENKGAT
jgi:hypothetical protein